MRHFPPGPARRLALALAVPALAVCFAAACNDGGARATAANGGAEPARGRHGSHRAAATTDKPILLEVFAPGDGDQAGIGGVSWFVDLDLEFPGNVHSTGITGPQLTGPGIFSNAPPFPGVFAPGKDDRFGGLVVLFSTTSIGAGSCQNTANLFNITGVTNVTETGTEIWDTWIITAANFGRNTNSTLNVAEVSDLNHDGVYNDAPDVVPDANHDGKCDASDVDALGTDSDIATINFFIR